MKNVSFILQKKLNGLFGQPNILSKTLNLGFCHSHLAKHIYSIPLFSPIFGALSDNIYVEYRCVIPSKRECL